MAADKQQDPDNNILSVSTKPDLLPGVHVRTIHGGRNNTRSYNLLQKGRDKDTQGARWTREQAGQESTHIRYNSHCGYRHNRRPSLPYSRLDNRCGRRHTHAGHRCCADS